ncbi:MAG: acyl-CoA dehydrogenase [Nocardia sp.]|uniref:acyl-CoA dehydrogenase family protein n=1 Tax=Nocardia sp. TaxID=1821 RepID=UPI0026223021|nr:acyl-CoA dehydrogenase family protein [Nocardia sp.]MCU1643050.1 acyl-CoA dehydrogenase [Nocardia sp.]
MRWELSEEQELFRESFAGWLDRFAPPESTRHWADSADPSAFDGSFSAAGWSATGFPEEIGGVGGGLLELALAAEELGRRAAPSATWLASALAIPLLPTDISTAALAGETVVALAVNASHAPDVASAFPVTERGTISGEVTSVLAADRAARLIVPVQSSEGTRLYLVDAHSAGVSITPRALLDRTRSAADIRLTDVAGTLLDCDAQACLTTASLRAAVLVAADALGAMERMLDSAVAYSKTRHQFGVPIGSFQAVKHAAATMLVSVEAGRSIAYFAATSVDEGHPDRAVHAAAAKAQVTAAAAAAADSALTLHGAIGYTWEHDLHLYYKRAKLDQHLFGSPSAWNDRIADLLPLLPAAS